MTIERFHQLSPRAQLVVVVSEGTRLAVRQHRKIILSLYYLADGGRGFFAEVGINEALHCIMVLRSFSSSVPLEDYAHQVQLPE